MLSYLYSARRFQKLSEMFSVIYFMAKLYMNKRVCRKAKIRENFKTARLPFCIFFAERTKETLSQSSLPASVFRELLFPSIHLGPGGAMVTDSQIVPRVIQALG